MELKKIKPLLVKYYDGSTSVEEEALLKAFFEQKDIPDYLKPDKEMFLFYASEKEEEYLPDFEKDILQAIEYEKESKESKIRHFPKYLYWVSSVAASLLIVLSLYFYQKSPSLEDTYDNPELAYLETKKVLYYVSSKLNKGTSAVEQNFSRIADGASEINRFSKINTSFEEVRNFSDKVEKIENLKYFDLFHEPEIQDNNQYGNKRKNK
ncbi:MAG: hypothetical protein J7L04_08625 [Bacteroidales bacterium]|nr:hypothetical protein [Bacteroidales bacterium]